MKFSKLVEKSDKLVKKHEKGIPVKPQKVSKLQQLLEEKKADYQARVENTEDPGKRKKLETRLRVVSAQLEKSKRLPKP